MASKPTSAKKKRERPVRIGVPNAIDIRRETFAILIAAGKNGTDAVRLAGYGCKDSALGATASRLLTDVKIQAMIKAATTKSKEQIIATAAERKEFLSKVMRNEVSDTNAFGEEIKAKLSDRIKATTELGKMEGDYIDRVLTVNATYVVQSPSVIGDTEATLADRAALWAKTVDAKVHDIRSKK